MQEVGARSASAPFFTTSWRAGKYLCELSVPPMEPGKPAHAVIEWTPELPTKPLSSSEQRAYRRGRDAAFAELMSRVVAGVAVLEL